MASNMSVRMSVERTADLELWPEELADAAPGWEYIHTHHRVGYHRFDPRRLES